MNHLASQRAPLSLRRLGPERTARAVDIPPGAHPPRQMGLVANMSILERRILSRGVSIIGAMALAASGVQVAVARPAASPAQPAPGSGWVAVLGDSYGSGEGAGPYAPGTDQKDNRCHRGYQGWAHEVAAQFGPGTELALLACSGSQSPDLYNPNQKYASEKPQLQQLTEQIAARGGTQPKAVFLSLGGNNVGFADVIITCYAAGTLTSPVGAAACDDMVRMAVKKIQQSLSGTLRDDYLAVLGRVDPTTPVYVIGYPQILSGSIFDSRRRCLWLNMISVSTSRLLGVASELDNTLARTVENLREKDDVRPKNIYYIPTFDVLRDRELCTKDSWVNAVVSWGTVPRKGVIPSPSWGWANESAHPNSAGQRAVAARIKEGVTYMSLPRTTDKGSELALGQNLLSGESLFSPNRKYRLTMQTDGNLVIYRSDGPSIWDSRDFYADAKQDRWRDGIVAMQTDGNLVHYEFASTRALWSTNSQESGRALRLQDDGNLVLIGDNGTVLWPSNSVQRNPPLNSFPINPLPPVPPQVPELPPAPAIPEPPAETLVRRSFQVDRYMPRSARQARIVASLDDDSLLKYREDKALWGRSRTQFVTVKAPLNTPISSLIASINEQTSPQVGDVRTDARLRSASRGRSYIVAWELSQEATESEPWGKDRKQNQKFTARS